VGDLLTLRGNAGIICAVIDGGWIWVGRLLPPDAPILRGVEQKTKVPGQPQFARYAPTDAPHFIAAGFFLAKAR
jgi:hypothetical protein